MPEYTHSGKINLPLTLAALLIAIALSVGLGMLYGWLMSLTDFIIVDALFALLVIVCLAVAAAALPQMGKVRNQAVRISFAIVISVVSWYAAWAYVLHGNFQGSFFDFGHTMKKMVQFIKSHEYVYERISSSVEISGIGVWIFAGLEAVCFLVPLFFVLSAVRNYYCERCEKFNEEKTFYITDAPGDLTFESAALTGNFNEVANLPRRNEVPLYHEKPDPAKTAYEIELSCCPNCKKNGVVNIKKGHFETDEKKKKISFEGKKFVSHALVDDFSVEALAGELFTGTPQ